MALTREQKEQQVKELTEKMSSASSIVFAHYIGLNVAESGELRQKLRDGNAEMKVAKKTLIKIAAKEAGLPEISDEVLDGPVSIIMSTEDPLTGAQIAFKFAKDHEQVALIGGIFDGKVLSKEEAIALAKMPSREVLLATFVGMLQAPLRGFAGVCSSPLSGFARGLQQIADKGGFGDAEEAAPAEEAAAPAAEKKAEEEAPKEEAAAEPADAPAAEAESTEEATSDAPAEEASTDTATDAPASDDDAASSEEEDKSSAEESAS